MKHLPKIEAGWLIVSLFLLACTWFTTELYRVLPMEAPEPEPVKRLTRPQVCLQFYNDDTDDWVECMGVGYVPH